MFTILGGPFTKMWSLNMETKQGSLDMYGSVAPYGVVNEFGDWMEEGHAWWTLSCFDNRCTFSIYGGLSNWYESTASMKPLVDSASVCETKLSTFKGHFG